MLKRMSCHTFCALVSVRPRYLESCTGPALKRKSDAHSLATSSSSSSTSEDDKPAGATDTAQTNSDGIKTTHPHSSLQGNHVGKNTSRYSPHLFSFPSGAGQWGVCGPHSSSSRWGASDRHHPSHQGNECSLCHQPVFVQQHYCPCATA